MDHTGFLAGDCYVYKRKAVKGELVAQAKRCAPIQHHSVPKQIEYWAQIGRIVEENPDLPFSMIRNSLLADQEEPVGEYKFDCCGC